MNLYLLMIQITFTLAGTAQSNISPFKFDTLLVKYNTDGNIIWNKTWGGSVADDVAYDVVVNDQGDIYIAGSTKSYGALQEDFVVIKYNSTGDKKWNETWGGLTDDSASALCLDSQGNIHVVGSTSSYGLGSKNLALACFNSTGSLLWDTTWGSYEYEYAYDIAIDSQDYTYMIGRSSHLLGGVTPPKFDFFLVKYNNSGIPIWSKIWGGDGWDVGTSLTIDSSDNIYIAGDTENYEAGLEDVYMSKFSSDGEQL